MFTMTQANDMRRRMVAGRYNALSSGLGHSWQWVDGELWAIPNTGGTPQRFPEIKRPPDRTIMNGSHLPPYVH